MQWTVLLVAVLIAGCSTDFEPSAADLKARWDAQNIYPQTYKNDLLAFLRTYLNNPEHVRDAQVAEPVLKQVGPGQRFVVCLRYNARNSDNRYMGDKDGAAVYVSGKLDQFVDQARTVRELCKDASYVPFPELGSLTR
jgi:hypothetical protein